MKKFQVPHFGQHLTYKGRDLVDNEATLASLRISPGTTILLQVIIDSQTARRDFFSSRFFSLNGSEPVKQMGGRDTSGCIARSTTNRKTKHELDPTKIKGKHGIGVLTRWEKRSFPLVLYVVIFFVVVRRRVTVLRKKIFEVKTTVFFVVVALRSGKCCTKKRRREEWASFNATFGPFG